MCINGIIEHIVNRLVSVQAKIKGSEASGGSR
jgi:hypothetical protein